MKRTVKHVAVHKSSWILAVCFTCVTLAAGVINIPAALLFEPSDKVVGQLGNLLIMPFVAGLGTYLCSLLFFAVYNRLAKKFGGIEIEMADTNPTKDSSAPEPDRSPTV